MADLDAVGNTTKAITKGGATAIAASSSAVTSGTSFESENLSNESFSGQNLHCSNGLFIFLTNINFPSTINFIAEILAFLTIAFIDFIFAIFSFVILAVFATTL